MVRMLGPQPVPCVGGMSDVLHTVRATRRIVSLKIKRPEIDSFISMLVNTVESHANETFLKHIRSSHVKLNAAIGKIYVRPPAKTVAVTFVQMKSSPIIYRER